MTLIGTVVLSRILFLGSSCLFVNMIFSNRKGRVMKDIDVERLRVCGIEFSVEIPPDDLMMGEYVSIVETPKRNKRVRYVKRTSEGCQHFEIAISKDSQAEESRAGIPHRLLGVSWPWATLSILCPGGAEEGPVMVDLTKVKLMRLHNNYVEAIKNFSCIDNAQSGKRRKRKSR
jgi:hypothetical protein